MLSWAEAPRPSWLHGDSDCVAREDLDLGLGSSISDVTVHNADKSHQAFYNPQGNNDLENTYLRQLADVNINPGNRGGGNQDMNMKESFIKGVTDDGWRLKE